MRTFGRSLLFSTVFVAFCKALPLSVEFDNSLHVRNVQRINLPNTSGGQARQHVAIIGWFESTAEFMISVDKKPQWHETLLSTSSGSSRRIFSVADAYRPASHATAHPIACILYVPTEKYQEWSTAPKVLFDVSLPQTGLPSFAHDEVKFVHGRPQSGQWTVEIPEEMFAKAQLSRYCYHIVQLHNAVDIHAPDPNHVDKSSIGDMKLGNYDHLSQPFMLLPNFELKYEEFHSEWNIVKLPAQIGVGYDIPL